MPAFHVGVVQNGEKPATSRSFLHKGRNIGGGQRWCDCVKQGELHGRPVTVVLAGVFLGGGADAMPPCCCLSWHFFGVLAGLC